MILREWEWEISPTRLTRQDVSCLRDDHLQHIPGLGQWEANTPPAKRAMKVVH